MSARDDLAAVVKAVVFDRDAPRPDDRRTVTRFAVADDGHGDACLWAQPYTGELQEADGWVSVLRRSRMNAPEHWDAIVAAVLGQDGSPGDPLTARLTTSAAYQEDFMRYRKKPVVIEAMQWKVSNGNDVCEFVGRSENGLARFLSPDSAAMLLGLRSMHARLWVDANQSWLPVEPGEWILKDRHGFYPCKDDVFTETYELVADDAVPDDDRLLRRG